MVWTGVAIPSNFVLSVALILPDALGVASAIEIATAPDAITVGLPVIETGAVAVIVCLLAIMVVFPVEVTSPVRFALVVTVAAFPVVF